VKLDWSVVWTYREALLEGALVTVLLTALTMAIAVPGGLVLTVLRQSRFRPLSLFGTAFVEFFRNLPLILVVYWAFYVVPILVDLQLSPFATGLLALSLNVSAYNAETFRAGVNSIRRGQSDAGLALGMSRWQTLRKIVLPLVAAAAFNSWLWIALLSYREVTMALILNTRSNEVLATAIWAMWRDGKVGPVAALGTLLVLVLVAVLLLGGLIFRRVVLSRAASADLVTAH
jgi:His/Glu/Gln/Arg/opine family amino acid ABC transporter permease subunit